MRVRAVVDERLVYAWWNDRLLQVFCDFLDAFVHGAGKFRRRVRAALGAANGTDVSIVAADERRNFEAHSLGFETVEAPLDLHDIVVARWRASARGKDAR